MLSKTSLPKVFTIPTVGILLVLSMVPTIFAVIIALQNRVLGQPEMDFVWLSPSSRP
jgi:multiple sugar transport system permease protein